MPEMLSPSAALVGSGLGTKVALVTDGRFSGATHGIQAYVAMYFYDWVCKTGLIYAFSLTLKTHNLASCRYTNSTQELYIMMQVLEC